MQSVKKRLQDSPAQIQRTPKQRRLSLKVKSATKKRNSRSSIWNESDGDDSIFGNILSQDFVVDEEDDCLNANIFCDDLSDTDSTICEQSDIKKSEEKSEPNHHIEFNETFEIPPDLEEEKPKDEFQNTEKFFDDIKVDFNESDFREFQSSSQIGTSYETREDIKNSQMFKVPATPKGLSQLCWQTQVFEEESKSKGLFLTKGPFYGLPVTVEKLIYSSKGIKSLYGIDFLKVTLTFS